MSNINDDKQEFVTVNNLKRFLQNSDERFAPNKNMEGIKSDGAGGYVAGKAGLVPAPSSSSYGKFLRSDGTWAAPEVPTKVSELDNDSNFLTSSDLSAHTSNENIHVSTTEKTTWNNKQNALTIQQINNINAVPDKANASDLTSHTDDTNIHVTPTEKTTWTNKANKATTLSGYGITDAYTKTQVDKKVSDLVNSAPETLDTLNELASALGNDPNFATTVANQIGTKANNSDVVHKSGDETITGAKTFTPWQTFSNGINVKWITGNKEKKTLSLYGSMNDKYQGFGSTLVLHGDDVNYGMFALIAKDKTNTNVKQFIGLPDGTLTWVGNTVLTEGNGVTTNTAQTISGNKVFTGTVKLQDHNVAFKNNKLDLLNGTTDTWTTMGLSGNDKNGKRVGFADWWAGKNGNCDFRIFCRDRKDNEKEVLLAGVKDGVTYVVTGGKNMVRSINGYVADTNGNIAYNIGNDLHTVNADTAIGSIRLLVYRGSTPLTAMDITSGGNLSLISIAISSYDYSVEVQYGMYSIVALSTMPGTWRNIGPSVTYGCSSLFIRVA